MAKLLLTEELAEQLWSEMRSRPCSLGMAAGALGLSPNTVKAWRQQGKPGTTTHDEKYEWFYAGCELAQAEAVNSAVDEIKKAANDRGASANALIQLYEKVFPVELGKRAEMRVDVSGGIKFERVVTGLEAKESTAAA